MRPIPLLADEGAERERDSAKPQEWLRHQKNAAKPQRRRRRARSASAIARSRNTRSASAIARSRNTRSASAIARSRNSGQFGWPWKGAELTTPSATNRNGSVFLMSRTTLLCEEGNVRPENFVQTTKSC